MAKISLCMIVKEETTQLLDTLVELADYVDEVIIATQDKKWIQSEKKIKQEQIEGLRGTLDPQYNIYYYAWHDDFAAARNDTFSRATGDVIFWIDADDVVLHPEKLPELAQAIVDGKCDWIHLEYLYEKDDLGNIRMRQWKPRLMRKGTGTWKKSVHEVFEPTTEVVQIVADEVVIDHQHTGPLHTKESGERNLRILMKEFEQDKDNTDPRTLYYLGNTLMAMSRWDEALPFYMMHIQKCGWPEEKYFSMHYAAQCYKALGKIDSAINLAYEMMKLFPQWSLAFFDLAEYYSLKDDAKRVIEWTNIGLSRQKPDSKAYFTSDLDYTVHPLCRLSHAYLLENNIEEAYKIASVLAKQYPDDKIIKELHETCKEAMKLESFVQSFLTVAEMISNHDRIKAARLFDSLPSTLDEDNRIQAARGFMVPPKTWDTNSIAIYCGKGNGEAWAQPSIYTGIGGSEEAVIYMGQELTKLGYKVTVYNECGDYRGTYQGVEYLPYFHFNSRDNFQTLIAWRTPGLFNFDLKAKLKLIWLHDIAYPQQFNQKIIDQADKIIFLSKWHRSNMPDIPEDKIFISNNGINPKDFENLPPKKPHSLVWPKSYDRGLLTLVRDIMPLVLKEVPDAHLDVCYGWDTIDREIKAQPGIFLDLEKLRAELTPLLDQSWITHHGRVSHKKVAELLGQSLIHPYPTEFGETNNIISQKAQVARCYVITTSQSGGTPEYIAYGCVVQGNGIYTDKVLQAKFADRVVKVLKKEAGLTKYDEKQPEYIKQEFSWQTTAKHWHNVLLKPKVAVKIESRASKPVRKLKV